MWKLERLNFLDIYDVEEGSTNIGRHLDANIICNSKYVSRSHCQIQKSGDHLHILDFKSANGTFINEHKIPPDQLVEIRDGDILGIGAFDKEKQDEYFLFKVYYCSEENETLKRKLDDTTEDMENQFSAKVARITLHNCLPENDVDLPDNNSKVDNNSNISLPSVSKTKDQESAPSTSSHVIDIDSSSDDSDICFVAVTIGDKQSKSQHKTNAICDELQINSDGLTVPNFKIPPCRDITPRDKKTPHINQETPNIVKSNNETVIPDKYEISIKAENPDIDVKNINMLLKCEDVGDDISNQENIPTDVNWLNVKKEVYSQIPCSAIKEECESPVMFGNYTQEDGAIDLSDGEDESMPLSQHLEKSNVSSELIKEELQESQSGSAQQPQWFDEDDVVQVDSDSDREEFDEERLTEGWRIKLSQTCSPNDQSYVTEVQNGRVIENDMHKEPSIDDEWHGCNNSRTQCSSPVPQLAKVADTEFECISDLNHVVPEIIEPDINDTSAVTTVPRTPEIVIATKHVLTKPILIEALPIYKRRTSRISKENLTGLKPLPELDKKKNKLKKKFLTDCDSTVKRRKRKSQNESNGSVVRKKQNEKIRKDRKDKLKVIAAEEALKHPKNLPECRILNKPHVKNTSTSRGSRLVEDIINKPATSRETRTDADNKTNGLKVIDIFKNMNLFESRKSIFELGRIPKKKCTQVSNPSIWQAPLEQAETIPKGPKIKNPVKSSILKSALKDPGCTKPSKKHVRINDKPAIKYFYIDDGNSLIKCRDKDAPIVAQNISQSVVKTVNSWCWEEVLWIFTKWNTAWLDEQLTQKVPPPLFKTSNYLLDHMHHTFSDYNSYQRKVIPLMLMELWSLISQEWIAPTKDIRSKVTSTAIDYVALDKLPEGRNLVVLNTHMLLNTNDFDNWHHTREGDIVILCLKYDGEGCTPEEKRKRRIKKVFAYVSFVRKDKYRPNQKIHPDLFKDVPNPYGVLYLKLKMGQRSMNIISTETMGFSIICYARTHMNLFQGVSELPKSPLCKIILSPRALDFIRPDVKGMQISSVVDKNLNPSQINAILMTSANIAKADPTISLIQGPPGTGKSHVLINLVKQILYGSDGTLKKDKRILICAHSNASVDELVVRLLHERSKCSKETSDKFRLVRVGILESMNRRAKDISVQELAKRELNKYCANENSSHNDEINFYKERSIEILRRIKIISDNGNDVSFLETKLRTNDERLSLLQKRVGSSGLQRQRERVIQKNIIEKAHIICTTLASCMNPLLRSLKFHNCIVDEATQCTEADTLVPLMLGVQSLVLIGDPQQLPATIISPVSKKYGLSKSLFARLQTFFEYSNYNPVNLLNTQYRMHTEICKWPNSYFYDNALETVYSQKDKIRPCPIKPYLILSLDCVQNKMRLENFKEGDLVVHLTLRIAADTKDLNYSIGIITPYQNQKSYILDKFKNIQQWNMCDTHNIDVNTIDSFQGQERDVVIISLVRSEKLGFLSESDSQRLNVALTRARHSLIICGNFSCMDKDAMWNAFVQDAASRNTFINILNSTSFKDIYEMVKL